MSELHHHDHLVTIRRIDADAAGPGRDMVPIETMLAIRAAILFGLGQLNLTWHLIVTVAAGDTLEPIGTGVSFYVPGLQEIVLAGLPPVAYSGTAKQFRQSVQHAALRELAHYAQDFAGQPFDAAAAEITAGELMRLLLDDDIPF